jgi:ketosteroid isomerase-like protein
LTTIFIGMAVALSITAQARASKSEDNQIQDLIAKYAKSIDDADTPLAPEVWLDSPDVSFIHPLGHEHGWQQVQRKFYKDLLGSTFSDGKLKIRESSTPIYGDADWAEFYWDFDAKFAKEGSPITTHGRETQVYQKMKGRWWLVHVHYCGMPATEKRKGF